MKKLLFLLVTMCSLVGCNKPVASSSDIDSSYNAYPSLNFQEKEIKADDYTFHQWTEFSSGYSLLSSETFFTIAEFKSEQPIIFHGQPEKSDDGFYHYYFSFNENNEVKVNIPETGKANYKKSNEFDLTLVKVIGSYHHYCKYYYSEKAHSVKEAQATYESIDASKEDDDMLQGKEIAIVFLNNYGEFTLMGNSVSIMNIKTVERASMTQYLQVDKDVKITFTHNSR